MTFMLHPMVLRIQTTKDERMGEMVTLLFLLVKNKRSKLE